MPTPVRAAILSHLIATFTLVLALSKPQFNPSLTRTHLAHQLGEQAKAICLCDKSVCVCDCEGGSYIFL